MTVTKTMMMEYLEDCLRRSAEFIRNAVNSDAEIEREAELTRRWATAVNIVDDSGPESVEVDDGCDR